VKVFLQVKLFQLREQMRVIFRYYRNVRFALVDLGLCFFAFFFNPYRICRKFTGTHSYGETPITTFAELAKAADLAKEDVFVDLGAGRGKLCFWASLWIGCESRGVEQVPGLVRPSKWLAKAFCIPVRFDQGMMETADLSHATVVYLYTMEWDETLLLEMPQGARLITVGSPVDLEGFTVVKAVEAEYPWGTAEVFIQQRVPFNRNGYIRQRLSQALNPTH
jgi:hypothetical protein